MRSHAIVIKGVSHTYRDHAAVADVSFTLAEGEFATLVGSSGCGKTTLLNMVAGLVQPSSGTVSVLGQAPVRGNYEISYMMARDALFPWRTSLENVALGAELRGVPPGERRDRAMQLLGTVGLGRYAHEYPKALSQGMRQRVALARTFCIEAPILLMDEPFAALDAQTKLALEDLLLRLWETENKTVLFVTHDLNEAIAVSDRVIVMSAGPGQVIADISIDLPRPRSVRALQSDERYHRVYSEIWATMESSIQSGPQLGVPAESEVRR